MTASQVSGVGVEAFEEHFEEIGKPWTPGTLRFADSEPPAGSEAFAMWWLLAGQAQMMHHAECHSAGQTGRCPLGCPQDEIITARAALAWLERAPSRYLDPPAMTPVAAARACGRQLRGFIDVLVASRRWALRRLAEEVEVLRRSGDDFAALALWDMLWELLDDWEAEKAHKRFLNDLPVAGGEADDTDDAPIMVVPHRHRTGGDDPADLGTDVEDAGIVAAEGRAAPYDDRFVRDLLEFARAVLHRDVLDAIGREPLLCDSVTLVPRTTPVAGKASQRMRIFKVVNELAVALVTGELRLADPAAGNSRAEVTVGRLRIGVSGTPDLQTAMSAIARRAARQLAPDAEPNAIEQAGTRFSRQLRWAVAQVLAWGAVRLFRSGDERFEGRLEAALELLEAEATELEGHADPDAPGWRAAAAFLADEVRRLTSGGSQA